MKKPNLLVIVLFTITFSSCNNSNRNETVETSIRSPKTFYELYCDDMIPSGKVVYLYDEFLFAGESPTITLDGWNDAEHHCLMVDRAANVLLSTMNDLRTAGLFAEFNLETFNSIIIPAKQEVFSRYYSCAPFSESKKPESIREGVVAASNKIHLVYNTDATERGTEFPENLRADFLQSLGSHFDRQNLARPAALKTLIAEQKNAG